MLFDRLKRFEIDKISWSKIKEIVSGVAYGSIDQKLNQREKLTYGFVGLIIAVGAQVSLAWWVGISAVTKQVELAGLLIPDRALLNIVVFPFQLLGIISLIYVVQGFTEYPYKDRSFWNLGKEKYVPFFIRARTFMYQPYLVVFVLSQYLAVYMDNKTGHPYFYFWFIWNNSAIILAVIVANWLKTFLKKFEDTIGSMKNILTDEQEIINYEQSVRNQIFNRKELAFILILFLLGKLNDVILNSDGTWRGGAPPGYEFPLTAIWYGFSIYIIIWAILMVFGSVGYVYYRIDFALKILKNYRANVFLFHPDGHGGLGEVFELLFSFLTKILLLISLMTFGTFLALQTAPTDTSWRQLMITSTITTDLFALIIFLYPLMEMRSIIKRKKEDERKILLERIKQKEEAYLKTSLKSNEFQEIENTFRLIKHIDAIPEWGIGSKQWLSLLGRVLITFNGVVLPILLDYLKKYLNI